MMTPFGQKPIDGSKAAEELKYNWKTPPQSPQPHEPRNDSSNESPTEDGALRFVLERTVVRVVQQANARGCGDIIVASKQAKKRMNAAAALIRFV
ncbi:MAG: hypothetical protein ACLU0O_05515 [Collinsella sp.]